MIASCEPFASGWPCVQTAFTPDLGQWARRGEGDSGAKGGTPESRSKLGLALLSLLSLLYKELYKEGRGAEIVEINMGGPPGFLGTAPLTH